MSPRFGVNKPSDGQLLFALICSALFLYFCIVTFERVGIPLARDNNQGDSTREEFELNEQ
jgi:hypothetical protein